MASSTIAEPVTKAPSKPKANGIVKPAKAKKAAAKPKAKAKKPAKKESTSPSRQLVQLSVRHLDTEPDKFVALAKGKGIKAPEARVRSIFARCKFIVAEFKAR